MTLLLQREFITPTASFERIYREAVQPTLEELSRLLGAAGDGVPPLDNKILSFSVLSWPAPSPATGAPSCVWRHGRLFSAGRGRDQPRGG
jgi:hypothetical protein